MLTTNCLRSLAQALLIIFEFIPYKFVHFPAVGSPVATASLI